MASLSADRYVLSFYVPQTHTEHVTQAIFKTGAGTWPGGTYSETCFVVAGTGQFRPLKGANPNIGNVGELEKVQEHNVEMVVFGKEVVQKAVQAMRESHPYEVAAYFVIKTEDI